MRSKTLIQWVIVLIIPVLFYFVMSGFKGTNNETAGITNPPAYTPPEKDFINYIHNESYSRGQDPPACFTGADWLMENFLDKYRSELGFNAVQLYDSPGGTNCMGVFNDVLRPDQIAKVDELLIGAHQNNLKAIINRSNFTYHIGWQRLVYEVKASSGSPNVNNGFCYRTISGAYEVEPDGTTAIHACVNPVNCNTSGWDAVPQYICSNIYENLQHTDMLTDFRDKGNWYLKPRIKIKEEDFSPTDQTPVVTIEAWSFDNTQLASKVIRIRNFKNDSQQYHGTYKDIFNFSDEPPGTNLIIPGGSGGLGKGWIEDWRNDDNACKVDFKIKWEGNVDVWFDKLTVDDERGDKLFAHIYDDKIDQDLAAFAQYTPQIDIFYFDEIQYSNIACAKYVVDYVRSKPNFENTRISIAGTNYHNVLGLKNDNLGFRPLLEAVHPDYLQVDAHGFYGWRDKDYPHRYYEGFIPENVTVTDILFPAGPSPNGWKAPKADYNDWLQNTVFGNRNSGSINYGVGSFVYQVALARNSLNAYSPNTRFIMQPQIHGWLFDLNRIDLWNGYDQGLREPMNSEYQAQAMISIAHGAEGLSWFWFNGFIDEGNWNQPAFYPVTRFNIDPSELLRLYSYGMINPGTSSRREQNCYNENKWQYIGNTNKKILEFWKPILDAANWQSGWSVHSEGANHQCISDIQSIKRNASAPYNFDTGNPEAQRYWEMGFYEPSQPNLSYVKYIVMVNRRCIPETSPGEGDIRQLKVRFNPEMLLNFDNWKLTDLTTNTSLTFHKNNQGTDGFLNLGNSSGSMGYFEPGEGKFYRLAPTLYTGGTLVADEVMNGEEITSLDTVFSNGYNITINNNSEIHFIDSSTFVMEGGSFTMGDAEYSGPANITCDAATGNNWNGFTFINCSVRIYNSIFNGVTNDTVYPLNIIDCPVVDIRNNEFSNSNDSYIGAVNVTYYNIDSISNAYIANNTFNYTNSVVPVVSVISYAGITTPLIIEGNSFSSSTANSTAILLSGITGGALKVNTITGFQTGINLLSSYVDVYDNTLSSSLQNAIGIFAASGSEIKMSPAGYLWLGGLNEISNPGLGSKNVSVAGAYFLMDQGENIFNIDDAEDFHLSGYFPESVPIYFTTDATLNCFKLASTPVNPPYQYVTWGEGGQQVQFTFTPYLTGCQADGGEGLMAINLGNGIYDSIMTEGGGGGGGSERISDVRYEILDLKAESEVKSKAKLKTKTEANELITLTPKQLNDSINILMRYRNYAQAKNRCYEMINTYPDSIQSINSISKLFLAVTSTDASQNGITQLKTYYETLILNHANNTALVQHCNYFVQKCKVKLHQYTSALTGFQQIINNNQYSYEGLVARWDYMATSLLMNGYGGGEAPGENYELRMKNLESDESEEWGDDKSPFTKEERITIKQNVRTAFERTKNYHEKKIEILEKQSKNFGEGNNEKAKHELQRMNTLRQVIKVEKPKDIIEHIKIVSSDIQKLFGGAPSTDSKHQSNLIPAVYRLAQNYPNPFNPVTTIQYELPKDSKVKLVIYDLLGREVKTLVNNEIKPAGYYRLEFNMQNYASGVYFMRIEADPSADSGGEKFVDAKKMVLVK